MHDEEEGTECRPEFDLRPAEISRTCTSSETREARLVVLPRSLRVVREEDGAIRAGDEMGAANKGDE